MKRSVAISLGYVVALSGLMLTLSSCSGFRQQQAENNARYEANERRDKAIDAEIAKNGFAVVGKMPDGRNLYMKTVDVGYYVDRVYFTDGSKVSTVSKRDCGKNCTTTAVTVQ